MDELNWKSTIAKYKANGNTKSEKIDDFIRLLDSIGYWNHEQQPDVNDLTEARNIINKFTMNGLK